ncbi:MAG: ABC transporter ATP-binding protein [Candidatus Dormibacteraeota bacterium]|uniref:ABC transporter ATP-binding protein n=1 Tax=Candidatus Dormiibacter inghamiae TaxID=3127013 RepID=A0A934NDI2_9BACT|nr:ABC transporter ATP-binding protein [Candidatus Dormibacteraeota bacterium]MBJ7607651.1 ABC transporter ATP-binding protein [Candidatus Dormibacteraeota bacterium]
MAGITIESITKSFAGVTAVDNVSLTIEDGEFMVLLGPSGCGKTTLLRLIAGFDLPDSGRIAIGDRDVTDSPPGRRDIAMVFQSYALFPHLRVSDNIAFGLRMHHVGKDEVTSRVREAAELMGIEALLNRYPTQLSGGQRQRVAVARALVMRPSVILMDEPLSNLDALLRLQMRAELKHLLQDIKTTTVYVTHDQVEALSMGDRTAVMRDGAVLQCASPMEVYDRPGDIFVATFIGNPPMNIVRAVARDSVVKVEGVEVALPEASNLPAGTEVSIGIRAENIEVHTEALDGALPATVAVIEPLGSHLLLTLAVGAESIKASVRTDFAVKRGDPLWLELRQGSVRLLGSANQSGPSD